MNALRDENVQVSGILFIVDFSDFPIRALSILSPSESRDVMKYQVRHPRSRVLLSCMQKCVFKVCDLEFPLNTVLMTSQGKLPGRFKGFWLINEGTFADALFTLFKPFLSKKFQERVRLMTLAGWVLA